MKAAFPNLYNYLKKTVSLLPMLNSDRYYKNVALLSVVEMESKPDLQLSPE